MQVKIRKRWVFLILRIEPLHQWMNCSVSKAKGCGRKYVGYCWIDCGIIALIRTNVLFESIQTNDFGNVIPDGNNLKE